MDEGECQEHFQCPQHTITKEGRSTENTGAFFGQSMTYRDVGNAGNAGAVASTWTCTAPARRPCARGIPSIPGHKKTRPAMPGAPFFRKLLFEGKDQSLLQPLSNWARRACISLSICARRASISFIISSWLLKPSNLGASKEAGIGRCIPPISFSI